MSGRDLVRSTMSDNFDDDNYVPASIRSRIYKMDAKELSEATEKIKALKQYRDIYPDMHNFKRSSDEPSIEDDPAYKAFMENPWTGLEARMFFRSGLFQPGVLKPGELLTKAEYEFLVAAVAPSMEEEFAERHPEVWFKYRRNINVPAEETTASIQHIRENFPKYIAARLNEGAVLYGDVYSVSKDKSNITPEGTLDYRLQVILGYELDDWNQNSREDFQNAEMAFSLLAYPRFSDIEKQQFRERLKQWQGIWAKEGKSVAGINLTPLQTQLVEVFASRIGISYDKSATNFPFSLIHENTLDYGDEDSEYDS